KVSPHDTLDGPRHGSVAFDAEDVPDACVSPVLGEPEAIVPWNVECVAFAREGDGRQVIRNRSDVDILPRASGRRYDHPRDGGGRRGEARGRTGGDRADHREWNHYPGDAAHRNSPRAEAPSGAACLL